MKILFVINPISGNKGNDKVVLRIHEKAIELGFDFKFLYTTGKDDEQNIRNQVKEYRPDRVVAGGGDGTLQLVARSILGQNIPFGILPLGSANGFATAVGIPKDPIDAVDLVVQTKNTRPLDLLKFNDEHVCIHLGDIGINALMVKEYGESDDRGMMAYAKHLISSMKVSPLIAYKIKTEQETFEKEGYMLAFANANKYGTGIHISEGSISDGKFEIINVPRIALEDAVKAGLTALNVFVDKDMFADVISCAEAEISLSEKSHFQIDGEYMGMTDRLSVRVLPSAVPLLIS
jgi:YegS/Rv2252/BmrU family lipid kinase